MASNVRRLLFIVLLLAAVSVTAQEKPAQPAPFTEVEALKVQNANLERILVQRALDDWRAKVAALKGELEAKRPGWVWNYETGEWAAVKPPDK